MVTNYEGSVTIAKSDLVAIRPMFWATEEVIKIYMKVCKKALQENWATSDIDLADEVACQVKKVQKPYHMDEIRYDFLLWLYHPCQAKILDGFRKKDLWIEIYRPMFCTRWQKGQKDTIEVEIRG